MFQIGQNVCGDASYVWESWDACNIPDGAAAEINGDGAHDAGLVLELTKSWKISIGFEFLGTFWTSMRKSHENAWKNAELIQYQYLYLTLVSNPFSCKYFGKQFKDDSSRDWWAYRANAPWSPSRDPNALHDNVAEFRVMSCTCAHRDVPVSVWVHLQLRRREDEAACRKWHQNMLETNAGLSAESCSHVMKNLSVFGDVVFFSLYSQFALRWALGH